METATMIISAVGALCNSRGFLQPYLNRAANAVVDRYDAIINIDSDIKSLESTLLLIQGILREVEEKQEKEKDKKVHIQNWLRDLVDIGYEARDVLDDFITYSKSVNFNTDLLSYINHLTCLVIGDSSSGPLEPPLARLNELAKRIKSVRERFDEKKKQSDLMTTIKSVVGGGGKKSVLVNSRPIISYCDEKHVLFVGRNDVKEEIMTKLLDYSDKSVRLISISGMGGVGKSTLARSIYNDERVKEEETKNRAWRKWSCIGQKFSAKEIMVEIIGDQSCSTLSVVAIQEKLVEKFNADKFKRSRFLIVLDDVWELDIDEWKLLWNPLTHVGEGGLIIITARKSDVVEGATKDPILKDLNCLSDDDCWRIFESHAFHGGKFINRRELEPIGREIVTKLGGLPLAAEVVGSSLLNEPDATWSDFLKTWERMLQNNDNRIMASLRWSYNLLRPHLKVCFTYFSLFPKDYVFDKKALVELWMAHDFIENSSGNRAEDTGADYFEELVKASLLKCDGFGKYVMHDMIHDLALLVSNEEFVTVNDLLSTDQIARVRHITINHDRNYSKNLSLCKSKRLLTLYTVKKGSFEESTACSYINIVQDVFNHLKSIRVLVLLSKEITDIPNCISELGHLRYLDISKTGVQRLPETLCHLYHLQMLAAPDGVVPPSNIVNMTNLRYARSVDLSRCKGVGKLTSLQELPSISVCEDVDISELGGLRQLRGKLAIKGLENVRSSENARQALMEEKLYLDELELEFSGDLGTSFIVLDALKCPPRLTYLKIVRYNDETLPSWIVPNLASSLQTLKLSECQNLKSLPPLGKMSNLKHLSLVQMHGIERIGNEFYGEGTESKVFFPSLESLGFYNMKKWKEWSAITILDSSASYFPRLTKLEVRNCPRLVSVIPSTGFITDVMRSLNCLEIMLCPEITDLTSTICFHTAIEDLDIRKCEKLTKIEFGSLQSLGRLTVISCPKLTSISGLVAVKDLWIRSCKELKSVRINFQGLDYIEKLHISKCPSLTWIFEEDRSAAASSSSSSTLSSPSSWSRLQILRLGHDEHIYRNIFENSFHKLKSLELLKIYNFDQLQSLPVGGLPHSLLSLIIRNCPQLQSLSNCGLPDSLEYLEIHHCRQLQSLSDCGLPASLQYLEIHNCPLLYEQYRITEFFIHVVIRKDGGGSGGGSSGGGSSSGGGGGNDSGGSRGGGSGDCGGEGGDDSDNNSNNNNNNDDDDNENNDDDDNENNDEMDVDDDVDKGMDVDVISRDTMDVDVYNS